MYEDDGLKQALDAADVDHTLVTIPRRQVLFRTGDRVSRMFCVLEGTLALIRTLENGQELVVQRAGAGDLLSEASLFSSHYHCDAVGETQAVCAAYDKDIFLKALKDPEIGLSFLKSCSREIRNLRSQVELRNIKRADDRVAAFLATLPKDGNGWREPGQTWKDAARTLGLTHEACYRALASLIREKRIEKADGRYRLIRP